MALTYSTIDVNPAQREDPHTIQLMHLSSAQHSTAQHSTAQHSTAQDRQDIGEEHADSLMFRMLAMADATCASVVFDMLVEEVACTTIGNVVVVVAAAAGAGAATAGAGAGTPVA